MSASYQDYTSFVSGGKNDGDFTMLGAYSSAGNSQSAPLQSVLKLSVAPGSEKYFSVKPGFQARLDNFRIAAPAMVPIQLTTGMDANEKSVSMTSTEGGSSFATTGSDYFSLGQTYKLNPY